MTSWHLEPPYVLIRDMLSKRISEVIPDHDLYLTLRENGLSGTVYPVLNEAIIPKEVYQAFRMDYLEYIRRGSLQEEAIQEIHQLFQEEKIPHVFLKGAYLRHLYPEALLRSMGDIDILVRPESMKQAHEVLPKHGYLLHAKSGAHDCFHKGKKVVIEVHPTLENQFDTRYAPLFDEEWKHIQERFDPIFETAYLCYHMMKHLSTSGLGIRNVLDLGLFLSKYQKEIDVEELHQFLNQVSMDLFFQNMTKLVIKMFAMEELQSFVSIPVQDDLLENTSQFLLKSGVHGMGKNHNIRLTAAGKQALLANNIKKGKLRYFMYLIFPPRRIMVGFYPILEKSPWFLPFIWGIRWFKLIFLRTKRTFRKIRKLHFEDQQIVEVESLYRRLGL